MRRRSLGPSVSFFAFQDIITAVVGIFILITLILVLELTQRVEAASSPPTANVDQIKSTIASLSTETERLSQEYTQRIEQQSDVAEINEFNRAAKIEEMSSAIQAASEQLETAQQEVKQANQRIEEQEQKEAELLRESEQLEVDRDTIAKLNQKLKDIDRMKSRLKSHAGWIYRDQTAEGRSLCILSLSSNGIEVQDAGSRAVRNFNGVDWFYDFKSWLDSIDMKSRHFLLLVRPSGAAEFERTRSLLAGRNSAFGFDLVGDDHEAQLSFQWEVQP
jgi:outer membrane murein-binding lipoprotein Lpp